MSNKKILDCARLELKGLNLVYQDLLAKHNALEAVDVCCCDCAFCRDAHAMVGIDWWPVADLEVCKACTELTQNADYKWLRDRCCQLRQIIEKEELMDEAVAMLIQATVNKEWQAAVNQTWPSKPATDRITLEGMQRMKRLMVQPKPLTFLIDTPRTRTPIVRLEYAHVIKNDFKSLED